MTVSALLPELMSRKNISTRLISVMLPEKVIVTSTGPPVALEILLVEMTGASCKQGNEQLYAALFDDELLHPFTRKAVVSIRMGNIILCIIKAHDVLNTIYC